MVAKKNLFEKGKTYYYPLEDWKLKFLQEEPGGLSVGAPHYTFKVMTSNPGEVDEFTTTLPHEIFSSKAEYDKSLKT